MNIFLENIFNLSFFFNTGIGIFAFVCIYILIVLLILPASWLSLLSGFLYGSYLGSIIVFISASIGASVAFFISKSFFAKKLKNLFSRYPKLSVMEKVVEKGGLKLIFLARLSPIFPFSMLNYFYGFKMTLRISSSPIKAPINICSKFNFSYGIEAREDTTLTVIFQPSFNKDLAKT